MESLLPLSSFASIATMSPLDTAEHSTDGFLPASPSPLPLTLDPQSQHGKYFGIPIGHLGDIANGASSGSTTLDTAPAEQLAPAKLFEAQFKVPVEAKSQRSTSSDEGLSILNDIISRQLKTTVEALQTSRLGEAAHESQVKGKAAAQNNGNRAHARQICKAVSRASDKTKYYYAYPEFSSTPTVIMRGGFRQMPMVERSKERLPFEIFFRKYPPPSNKDYEYTSDGRDPRFVYHPPAPTVATRSGAVSPSAGTVVQQQAIRPMIPSRINGPSSGEEEQADWHDKAIRLLGLGLGDSATDEERDFVYCEAFNLVGQRDSHCWRCDRIHIAFGPPETLPDRDTCGAYLPGWFPAQEYQYPWKEFRELWREIVYLEETERNFEFNLAGIEQQQQQPKWNREYHNADSKWADLYPECQGWWKCRSGLDATEIELSCVVCHKIKIPDDNDPKQKDFLIRKDALVKWVYGCLKYMRVDDWASAEGIVLRLSSNRISNYHYSPGSGEKARVSRLMPENLRMSIPLTERDENNKEKALEVLNLMVYPGILYRRESEQNSTDREHPYKYLSGLREPKPRHAIQDLWNDDYVHGNPASPKTYRTTIQENSNPHVDDYEKATDEEGAEKVFEDVGTNSVDKA